MDVDSATVTIPPQMDSLRQSLSHPPSAIIAHQDLSLDERVPLHRRSVEIRNSELPNICSRSSSSSSRRLSRSRSRVRRASFASIKESDTEIAQTFVTSPILDPPLPSNSPSTDNTAVFTSPSHPDFCSPFSAFRGWKRISLGGKRLSKSYEDLRLFCGWQGEEQQKQAITKDIEMPNPPKGPSTLERMPFEILDQIISYLEVETPANGYTPRNQDLMSCLLTCRTLHSATLSVLYRNITISHSIIFSKALSHISLHPSLGTLVRRLDFSHFTSIGLGRTKQMNVEIQNVTSKTLLSCLQLVPSLKEFIVQEHLDDDLSEDVLSKLFFDMPSLRAADFCACSSRAFTASMTRMLERKLPENLRLRGISLHECSTLPGKVFEVLLPLLPRMTILDAFHTQITNEALFSIPIVARITHLNIGKCTQLSGHEVVQFLTTHPAVKDSLVYLNLMSDISRHRILQNEDDVAELLSKLPPTLRSLNLSGAKITGRHIPLLLPLTKHLEELSLGFTDLSIREINSLFVPASAQSSDETISPEEINWVPSTLRYLDATGVPSVSQAELFSSSSILTSSFSKPLHVIELDEKLVSSIAARLKRHQNLGWVTRELGRRGWYVREPGPGQDGEVQDDGRRSWKMGARWWGMRKVGVAYAEVGGMYGHYMFKR